MTKLDPQYIIPLNFQRVGDGTEIYFCSLQYTRCTFWNSVEKRGLPIVCRLGEKWKHPSPCNFQWRPYLRRSSLRYLQLRLQEMSVRTFVSSMKKSWAEIPPWVTSTRDHKTHLQSNSPQEILPFPKSNPLVATCLTEQASYPCHEYWSRALTYSTHCSWPLPFFRVNSDGPWLVQPLWDHHIAEWTIESGHLNNIKALVCPIDVSWKERGARRNM